MTRPVGPLGRPNRGALLPSGRRRLSVISIFFISSLIDIRDRTVLALAGRRSRKHGGRKRPQEGGCGHRRSSGVSAHFGRRFHRSSNRAAGGNDQAVELLGRRSFVDGRSASGLASSAEKHAGDALAVLHVKGCEIGEFRSIGHLAYEVARRAY